MSCLAAAVATAAAAAAAVAVAAAMAAAAAAVSALYPSALCLWTVDGRTVAPLTPFKEGMQDAHQADIWKA